MKVHLLYPDRDFRPDGPLPWNAADLTADLDLEVVWSAMADGDRFRYDVARSAMLGARAGPDVITYRQDVLADCREHPAVVRALYELATEAVDAERRIYSFLRRSPSAVLRRSVTALELFVGHLRRLRQVVDRHPGAARSDGWRRFFAMVCQELDDAYFAEVASHLQRLRFRDGLWLNAGLGQGNRGVGHVLQVPAAGRPSWKERLGLETPTTYAFEVHPRDEAGHQALAELSDRGLNPVANALAQSTDHILAFFVQLRAEAGFYLGCVELERRMASLGMPTCRPEPCTGPPPWLRAAGLYDGALSLRTGGPVVGNDLEADGTQLVMVTGANSGGKSTFLRSVGLAQLMLASGMGAFATAYRASVDDAVLTHFPREEDAAMAHGRFDEELSRMNAIVDHLPPQATVLCNETFAGTNEWEGSEIGRQVVHALVDSGVRVLFVTHLYDLAHRLHAEGRSDALFLRAARRDDGTRTYEMVPGEPLPTSYGVDLYRQMGGWSGPERVA